MFYFFIMDILDTYLPRFILALIAPALIRAIDTSVHDPLSICVCVSLWSTSASANRLPRFI